MYSEGLYLDTITIEALYHYILLLIMNDLIFRYVIIRFSLTWFWCCNQWHSPYLTRRPVVTTIFVTEAHRSISVF